MLISKTVKIKWNGRYKKYYEDKGYIYTKLHDEFEVKVEDLQINSKVKVNCLCDYCLEITFPMTFGDYNRRVVNGIIRKCACSKCAPLKTKESNMITYGVVSPFQLEEIKQESRATTLNKYGVEWYTQTNEYKERAKETNLEKRGVEFPTQSKEVQMKITNTNNERYGCDNVFQNEDIKKKSKETMLIKFGVEHNSQSKEYKISYKETSLKNWGTEHPMQNKQLQEKAKETLYKNGTCKTSLQQLEVYNMLKNNFYNVELNFPIGSLSLDVALFINEIKIDIEYDGWYWHKDKRKDRARDEVLKSLGWKILRIKSGYNVPTLEQLIETINKLLTPDRMFTHIILNDWKDVEVI